MSIDESRRIERSNAVAAYTTYLKIHALIATAQPVTKNELTTHLNAISDVDHAVMALIAIDDAKAGKRRPITDFLMAWREAMRPIEAFKSGGSGQA